MPDHFHVLLTIDTGMTIEHAVQFIKVDFRSVLAGNWG